jgi:hypothetical protein
VKLSPIAGVDFGGISLRYVVGSDIKSGIGIVVFEEEVAAVLTGSPIHGNHVFKFRHDLNPFR